MTDVVRHRVAPRFPRAGYHIRRFLICLAAAVVLVATGLAAAGVFGGARPAALPAAGTVDLVIPAGSVVEMGQWCVDHNTPAFRRTLTTNGRTTLAGCVELWGAGLTPTPTVAPSPSPTPVVTTTAPPATTPPATTTAAPSPSATPTPSSSPASTWPGAGNTGVPDGTALTTYTGPCVITVDNTTIDAKAIGCSQLVIRAAGVVVTRSLAITTADPGVLVDTGDLSIADSTIVAAPDKTGLGHHNWSGQRLDISGGNRHANCDDHCSLTDSWLHGNRITGASHASALRAGQWTVAVHNSLACDVLNTAQGGGCSADLTGYPDFEPMHDWTIKGNLFVAQGSPGAYFCAYGGATKTKPYSNDPANAVNISFNGNVFQRGASKRCGGPTDGGPPITDYDQSRPGWLWSGNVWDSGEPVLIP